MLPDRYRLRASAVFTQVIRRGVKVVRPTLVMYALPGESRFGLIVSKAVGGAVVRNRVKRRLRHLAAGAIASAQGMTVVVRALPPAAVEGPGLSVDFEAAWRRCAEAMA